MALLTIFRSAHRHAACAARRDAITDMRTGAVTALGAKYLARKGSAVLGQIGRPRHRYWNVRLLDHLSILPDPRPFTSPRKSRDAFGATLSRDLRQEVA